MATAWFFLLGGPGETRATVEETLEFVERRLDWAGVLAILFTGIRVYPGSPLASSERAAGRLAAGDDLAQPRFYFSPEVSEEWILARIQETIARRPNVVHAAEGAASPWRGVLERFLAAFGVPPPYWRFLPRYLALPPVHALRRRFPLVRPGA